MQNIITLDVLSAVSEKEFIIVPKVGARLFSAVSSEERFEELGWIRRKLRGTLWRQWKRTYTRFKTRIGQSGSWNFGHYGQDIW